MPDPNSLHNPLSDPIYYVALIPDPIHNIAIHDVAPMTIHIRYISPIWDPICTFEKWISSYSNTTFPKQYSANYEENYNKNFNMSTTLTDSDING